MKQKMLQASIEKHQTVIDDFRNRIASLLHTEGTVNEDEFDNNVQALKTQATSEVNMLTEQLAFANREMELLYRLQSGIDTPRDTVRLGAAVITDRGTFFISASIEQFMMDGNRYIGLSSESPLFKRMEGKRSGDAFTYHGTTYTILDVF